ncbi:MAG: GyrI-like domain-containing protein [Cyclobacteriaceae bacterium]
MTPRIETIKPKMLIGITNRMSLANDQTSALWREFLVRKEEITNRMNTDRYSIQDYGKIDFQSFTPQTEFNNWAAVEVKDNSALPEGMKPATIEGGLYAVFIHHGTPQTFPKTFQQIFGVWLPASGYQLDQRAQFEIMKEDYSPFDDNAQEEVWIPIKQQP